MRHFIFLLFLIFSLVQCQKDEKKIRGVYQFIDDKDTLNLKIHSLYFFDDSTFLSLNLIQFKRQLPNIKYAVAANRGDYKIKNNLLLLTGDTSRSFRIKFKPELSLKYFPPIGNLKEYEFRTLPEIVRFMPHDTLEIVNNGSDIVYPKYNYTLKYQPGSKEWMEKL